MRLLFLAVLLISVTCPLSAQPPCAGPGRIPASAQAVCGNITFRESDVSNCIGPDLPNPTSGCGQVTTNNSRWYKFHCYVAGTLGFLITPTSPADDYDWEVMDITGHPPNDVFLFELRVSLNLSGQPGITGCTVAGVSDINCGGGAPGTQFNRLINLIAGHDYLMMVNNWSSSQSPYDIDFSGTAILTDNQPPTITSIGIVGCDATKLKITFSEDIKCTSITSSGSECTITGGPNVITGVVSDCSLSGAQGVPYLIINLQSALPSGNYQLNINDGTDGDTYRNVCLLAMLPASLPFTVPAIPPVSVTGVTFTGCAPTVLDVTLSKPVWCTSITQPNFSEFSILPGNPAITSIQSVCGTGPMYTSSLQIVLQNPLPAGNYQLVINNGGDGNTLIDTCNNSIPVGNSTPFVISTTTPPPIIQSINFDECHPDKVVLNFDKPVRCASITAAGEELSITPGVWPVNSINYTCIAGSYTTQITMNLQNPLPAGNYNVVVNNGITDGNTLSDTCFSFIPVGYSRPFNTTQASRPVFDSVQTDKCTPGFVKVFYNHPILCSSISANGSDFNITGPSAVNIVSATPDVTCATQGYTNWILLQLASAINTPGNYVLHNGVGANGTGITDTCNAKQNPAETISFNVLGKPSAVFNSVVNWGCVTDTIALSHPGGIGINSWTWNFSDGSSATGQVVSKIFPIATPTVVVQLIVSNGFCSDTTMQTITLGNVITAGFTTNLADTFCINTPVNFINTSTGNLTNYLWDFGDATQFNGANPPTHIYPTPNLYNVQLTVTDNNGCTGTASKLLTVNTTAYIDFSGLRPQYCTGNTVLLTRKIANTITSYVWDNGDGKTFTNEVDVNFSYANEGVYTITLTGQDKYCGTSTVSKTVPVYAVPKVSLGPDTILCKSDVLLLGVPTVANHTYLWNSGETTSQIYTSPLTRTYALTADNNGCRGYDAVSIKVLNVCLIRVPGAFTPNGDGINDLLKALNADLAKNFSFKVFNRLGQLVFATNNPMEGWDGSFKGNPESSGTFVWMLSYIDPWSGKYVNTKGTSILIR